MGSTRVVTSSSGAKVSEHRYWPFGEEMTVNSSPERMRFAGHERDANTSLDYMHARYYAPWGGRFLSVDPGRDYDFKSPQSFNLYAYVRNNPLSRVDPDGRADRRTPEEVAIFEDPDVLQAMGEIIQLSNYDKPLAERQEAGTYIFQLAAGDYAAAAVVSDSALTYVRLGALGPVVGGCHVQLALPVVGAVHSHPGSGKVSLNGSSMWLQSGRASDADKQNAVARGVPSYIIDANKRLLKFDPRTKRETKVLTGKDWRRYRERALKQGLVKVKDRPNEQ